MNFRGRIRLDPVGFQLTPMIDCIFLMLCFFLTSQVFSTWESEIDITLPTARISQAPQRLPGEIIVNIDKTGSTIINGRRLDESQLRDTLMRVAKLAHNQPVLIRADKQTAYEHVIRVIDLCGGADIWNVSFATAVPES